MARHKKRKQESGWTDLFFGGPRRAGSGPLGSVVGAHPVWTMRPREIKSERSADFSLRQEPTRCIFSASDGSEEMTMTIKQIEAKQAMKNIKYEAAKKIRAILDEARKQYGATAWDDNDVESEVVQLVTEEE